MFFEVGEGFIRDSSLRNVVGQSTEHMRRVSTMNQERGRQGYVGEEATMMRRTVVVSPVGTDTENGTALINTLAAISDASQTLLWSRGDASSGYVALHLWPCRRGAGDTRHQHAVDLSGEVAL
jgi:hypothetical protein